MSRIYISVETSRELTSTGTHRFLTTFPLRVGSISTNFTNYQPNFRVLHIRSLLRSYL